MIDSCFNEDCLDTMERLNPKTIDLVLTSPPYDELRSYGGYSSFDFFTVAESIYKVLKEGAVLVWVVADQVKNNNESGTSFKQALDFKDLGLKLFDTMIYQKQLRPMGSLKSYLQEFEYMFIFSKGDPNTINHIKDHRKKDPQTRTHMHKRVKDKKIKLKYTNPEKQLYSRRGNIWKYATGLYNSTSDPEAFEHPAIFPEKLAADHIISWTNEGDVVYDPFAGSGTVLKMAKSLNRHFYGSEINPDYWNICQKRLTRAANHRLTEFDSFL